MIGKIKPASIIQFYFNTITVTKSCKIYRKITMQILVQSTYTGYFWKVYRSLHVRVPHNILKYLSIQKLPQKPSHQSIYLSNSQKKIILCFNFITNINICKYILYFQNIFISIILNVHNDLCFEDKSSSLTLKYICCCYLVQ